MIITKCEHLSAVHFTLGGGVTSGPGPFQVTGPRSFLGGTLVLARGITPVPGFLLGPFWGVPQFCPGVTQGYPPSQVRMGYPLAQTGVPPILPKTEEQSEHLLRGGWYASCVHAGGLSCFHAVSGKIGQIVVWRPSWKSWIRHCI